MVVEEDAVAHGGARTEDAEIGRPLDWRDAVAADHFAHLDDRLRQVAHEGPVGRFGVGKRFAEELLSHGVDLQGIDNALEPALWRRLELIEDLLGMLEALAAGDFVPDP